jgi:hypothetical protein
MTDITDDDKIIELADAQKERPKPPGKKPGTADPEARRDLFKQIAKEAHDEAALEGITEDERTFAEYIVAGESFASAYELTFPEDVPQIIVKAEPDKDGKQKVSSWPDHQRSYQKGARIAKRPAVRAYVATRLDQEEGDSSHTSARLANFIVKRLEHEAVYASTPAARLKALEQLSKHKVVQVSEDLAGAKAREHRTESDLLADIQRRLDRVTNGNKE